MYEVYACYEQELDKRIKRLNAKAAKLQAGAVRLVKGPFSRLDKYVDPVTGETVIRPTDMIAVDVEGEVVKVDGYEFIAKIDFDNGVPLVMSAPGKEAPEWARKTDPGRCDQCQAHRGRKDVFILRGGNGDFIQVGRTCLKDFLGHDATHIVRLFQWLKSVEDAGESQGGFGGFAVEDFDPVEVLTVTAAVIRTFGWVSKGVANADMTGKKIATAWTVQDYLSPFSPPKERKKIMDAIGEITDADKSVALKTLAYLDDLASQSGLSDYEYNLVALRGIGAITIRRFGLFCSAVAAYHRAVDKEIKRAAEAAKAPTSRHVGSVGDKLEFEATIQQVRYLDGAYGVTTLITMIDQDGNIFKWFASGEHQVEADNKIVIKGTIKKHDKWNGQAQTILTRCKLKEAP